MEFFDLLDEKKLLGIVLGSKNEFTNFQLDLGFGHYPDYIGKTHSLSIYGNGYQKEPFVPIGTESSLMVRFDDVDSDADTEIAITINQARVIVGYIGGIRGYLFVHCDAGLSRSPGVVAAILKRKTGDDSAIFNSKKYMPNRRVYRSVLDAFNE